MTAQYKIIGTTLTVYKFKMDYKYKDNLFIQKKKKRAKYSDVDYTIISISVKY